VTRAQACGALLACLLLACTSGVEEAEGNEFAMGAAPAQENERMESAASTVRALNDFAGVDGITGIFAIVPSQDAQHRDWVVFSHTNPLGLFAVSEKAEVFLDMSAPARCARHSREGNDCSAPIASLSSGLRDDDTSAERFASDLDVVIQTPPGRTHSNVHALSNADAPSSLCTALRGSSQVSMTSAFIKMQAEANLNAREGGSPEKARGLWRSLRDRGKAALSEVASLLNPKVKTGTTTKLLAFSAMAHLLSKMACQPTAESLETEFPELANPELLRPKKP
jgi:hypothetical protein